MAEIDNIIRAKRNGCMKSGQLDHVRIDERFLRGIRKRIREEAAGLMDDGRYLYRYPKLDLVAKVKRKGRNELRKVHRRMMKNTVYFRIVNGLRNKCSRFL